MFIKESPRDYADIPLSMQHSPNIVTTDVSHKLAPHINFFDPYAGKVADPPEENIKAVEEGLFQQITMPWLNQMKLKSVPLFDKIHECNTKQEKEILRRTSLDGVVTETEEQLNSFLSKSIYVLDMLNTIHHYQDYTCCKKQGEK